ncbi:Proline racemase [Pseudoxanthobacter soli DSM 19599]|uniref:4-hydroxyproline epimerase n=1 Tax=Pseudoxanthobacter soli DSM 19599 TaxID=1123029 RepID=A0A1M7ZMH8_9HYPH|nr:proline racemase family protein [Pseudoxanthobacter soli]SHO66100.1 Proline racemase [Pseudoxanthobacter soli DSM 19599]
MSQSSAARFPFSIGHVAKVTGVAVSTIRSWENQGLLAPNKSAGGHRSYGEADIERIRRIDRMRRMDGQSLSAIRRVLDSEEEIAAPQDGEAAPAAAFNHLGARVRSLRQEAGLSLRELSDRTAIASSHLSMFERGVAFLSPARLNAIAEVFGRTLAELLGGTKGRDFPVVRRGQGRIVGSFGPGVTIEQLTVSQRLMDAEVWTIDPDRESDGFYAHEGEELIYVLEGSLELALADRDAEVLNPGDGAYFNSRIAHRWRNTGRVPAKVLWINTDSDRLSSMSFEKTDRRLGLGAGIGEGIGEGALSLELPQGARTFRVIETHTEGHPTHILIEPLEGLDADSVAGKARQFAERYDSLRPMLLHEPRGHSGAFGLVPVASSAADFGAFFISSYGYPGLCGHAIMGYTAALRALGRLASHPRFTIEVPNGILTVHVGAEGDADAIALEMPPAIVSEADRRVHVDGHDLDVAVVVCGDCYALVNADAAGLALDVGGIDRLLAVGDGLRRHLNEALPRRAGSRPVINSVLFHGADEGGGARQFLAIDRQKFDRSPGVAGLSCLLALRAATGAAAPGARLEAVSLFGGHLTGELITTTHGAGSAVAVTTRITGRAHLKAVATLIQEEGDPLGSGFLR